MSGPRVFVEGDRVQGPRVRNRRRAKALQRECRSGERRKQPPRPDLDDSSESCAKPRTRSSARRAFATAGAGMLSRPQPSALERIVCIAMSASRGISCVGERLAEFLRREAEDISEPS